MASMFIDPAFYHDFWEEFKEQVDESDCINSNLREDVCLWRGRI